MSGKIRHYGQRYYVVGYDVMVFKNWKNFQIVLLKRFSSWAVKSSALVDRLKNKSVSEYREIKNWYWNDLADK
ncbi:hypothetical protein BCR32DRAFT_283877 [Anaeromyces robustus]|uniref:Uncharacterized protein n=1 Tax=Anaeromyces robustus TaxID=1754192 RepID=A0A1Y1WT29_9FUNG|nr:hypothetical protein BCR32DRAFT_283877 [Anaeromyces robustus]|eukprot:ORX76699.1 hypothetical protein BCR32DRAFT_283877 [Anaeromyces robustus]